MAEFFTSTKQPYSFLLNRVEWRIRRDQVIRRDGCYCQQCGRFGLGILQVHHKYYMEGYDPWEYPDEALITLCDKCHRNLHKQLRLQNETVPLYKYDNVTHHMLRIYKRYCEKCGGVGYIWEFKHKMEGVCFDCWGTGMDKDVVRVDESEDTINFFRYRIRDIESYLLTASEFKGDIEKAFIIFDRKNRSYYVEYADNTGKFRTAPLSSTELDVEVRELQHNEYKIYPQLNGEPMFVLTKDIVSSTPQVNHLDVLKLIENDITLSTEE